MSKLALDLSINETAQLTGIPARKINGMLRKAKVNRAELPEVLLWIYPVLMLAKMNGHDVRGAWKKIKEDREQARQVRADAMKRRKNQHIMTANGPVYSVPSVDEFLQVAPEY
jgi:hypothetical protein